MPDPIDILDERDPIALPFMGALVVHGAVIVGLFFGWWWVNHRRASLGDINPAGGPAYAVSPVNNIPIPQRQAPPNPVANDTQSMVLTTPARQELERKLPLPDKNAFAIPEKVKRRAEKPQVQQHNQQPTPPNQIPSRTREAVSSPMYGGQSGAGQVGVGPNTPLGDNRLGWYAEIIRQRIAQNWNTNALDARTQRSPAIVSFLIMRDGSIRTPQIVQTSGNPQIDNTALRAVYTSNPLPGLPPQITESYITAQFTFNLH